MSAEDVRRKLENLIRQIPDEVGKALSMEAEIEKKESMERTPVKYGVLRGSHEVMKPEIKGRDISVAIVVGGPAAPYAVHVHYDYEAFHHVGQAGFLESTIMESKPYIAERVARRIDLNKLV